MSKPKKTTLPPANRPLEKDELSALERAHKEAASLSADLHAARAEVTELQQRLHRAKVRVATARGELAAATDTIHELTARLTA